MVPAITASLAGERRSDPVRLPDRFGPVVLKAGLPSDQIGLGALAFDALEEHYGSVKALAIEFGNADPSLVRRELKAGDFRRFEQHATADARAVVAEAVMNAYGVLKNAEDRAAEAIRRARQELDLLAQYIEHRKATA